MKYFVRSLYDFVLLMLLIIIIVPAEIEVSMRTGLMLQLRINALLNIQKVKIANTKQKLFSGNDNALSFPEEISFCFSKDLYRINRETWRDKLHNQTRIYSDLARTAWAETEGFKQC